MRNERNELTDPLGSADRIEQYTRDTQLIAGWTYVIGGTIGLIGLIIAVIIEHA